MAPANSRIANHFTWGEATVTQTGLKNEPGPQESANLVHTFAEMERVRALLGKPIIVHSAFRSPEVNKAVDGAPTSQHLKGEAVDFHVEGMTVREAFERIAASQLPYDQLIEEAKTWVHVSFVSHRPPRRQALVMRVVDGKKRYTPYLVA